MKRKTFIKKLLRAFKKKPTAIVWIAIAALILFALIRISGNAHKVTIPDGYLSVHYIDVGQGDASLIIDPDGHTVLIDTGTGEAKYYLCQYLKKYGVKDIDLLILSHPHSDHIGGASEIIKEFNVGKILMPDAVSDTPDFEKLLDTIEKAGKIIEIPEQNGAYTVGGMTVTVLSPTSKYSDENDMSIVTKVTYGNNSFLYTGDISSGVELDLLNALPDSAIKSDILKVPHHGSKYSSSDDFLSAVSPSLAVISCGADNDYGHPHRDTLKRLTELNIRYLVTSESGDIVLGSNGSDIILISPSDVR